MDVETALTKPILPAFLILANYNLTCVERGFLGLLSGLFLLQLRFLMQTAPLHSQYVLVRLGQGPRVPAYALVECVLVFGLHDESRVLHAHLLDGADVKQGEGASKPQYERSQHFELLLRVFND